MKKINQILLEITLAVGLLSACLPSANAVLTWQEAQVPNLPPGTDFASVWARNPQEVYVWGQISTNATPNAQLYRWNGATWTNVLAVNGQWSHSVFGVGSAEVFVACDTNIWRSTDNGTTWTLQSTPMAGSVIFRTIRGTQNNVHAIAYQVGNAGAGFDLRFDGTAWTVVLTPASGYWPLAQTQVSATEGYFLSCWGWGKWNGASWSVVNQGFDFCDIGDTWALRDSGGGLHWWAVGNNNFSNGIRIWCFDTNIMSFGGKSGYCFSDGSGYNVGSAYGIWASGENDVYVIGQLATVSSGPRSGRVYHFDGSNWSQLTTVGDIVPAAIWGATSDHVWIAGQNGRLIHGSNPDPQSFLDGFESARLNAFWSTRQDAGSITFPSTGQVHSGSQSVQFNSTYNQGNKYIELNHYFGTPQYGTVSVWIYDSGADLSSGNYIALGVFKSGTSLGAQILTFDYDLGPANGGNYYFNTNGTTVNTAIDRTQAWHKWSITITPQATVLAIDNQVVHSGPAGSPFDRVMLSISGPTWRPAFVAYFDDFSFVAAPRLDIRLSQVELCWNSASNVLYQVQYRQALDAGNWLPLGAPVSGTGLRMCVNDAILPDQPKRFYQVVVSNTP